MTNSYTFQHWSAILRECTRTKEHKSNMPIKVMIACELQYIVGGWHDILYFTRPMWMRFRWESSQVYVYIPQTNLNSCKLLHEESHYHIDLICYYYNIVDLCLWTWWLILEFNLLMTPVKAISTWIGVLDLCSFVLLYCLRKAFQCWNMQEFDTCHELHFIIHFYCIYWVHSLVDIVN